MMSVLNQMQPIGLDDMKAVRLMNRVDQKYMASADLLEELLTRIAEGYYVQQIEGNVFAPYRTLYFDTDDLRMYTMHHNQCAHTVRPTPLFSRSRTKTTRKRPAR